MRVRLTNRIVVIAMLGAFLAPSSVHATSTIYTVGTNSDTGAPASLAQCTDPANTTCRLRDALGFATSGTDTIQFNTTGRGTILLTGGTLTLAVSVTIIGPTGGAGVTLDGNHAVRVLLVNSGVTATVSNLTIAHGTVYTAGGGGIFNSGTLTLTNSTVSGNNAGGSAEGGGIYNDSGATLTVTNSTISSNAGWNGAITTRGGTLTLTNSSVVGNISNGLGAGGIIIGGHDSVTLTNSTVSGNIGHGNLSSFCGGAQNFGSGTLRITNMILAGNFNDSVDTDVCGPIISLGYNLIGNAHGTDGLVDTDIQNVNPVLAYLGDYGGPTQTMALLPGSPALGAGTASGAPATDQRGIARVGHVDIGAFQSHGFTLEKTSGDNQSTAANTSFPNLLVVTVASAYNEPVLRGVVTFTGPVADTSIRDGRVAGIIGPGGGTGGALSANSGVGGPYHVTASAAGASPSILFTLTNTVGNIPVAPGPPGLRPATPVPGTPPPLPPHR